MFLLKLINDYYMMGLESLSFPVFSTAATDIILTVVFFFLGGSIASFVCVVAERGLAEQKWWGMERSHCDSCGKQLSWYELIPIFSYLIQMGKCRSCHAKIPARYFVIELFSALFLSFSYIRYGLTFGTIVSGLLIPLFAFHFITDVKYEALYDGITAGIALVAVINCVYSYGHSLAVFYSGLAALLLAVAITALPTFFEKFGAGDMLLYGALAVLVGRYYVIPLLFIASIIAILYVLLTGATMKYKNRSYKILTISQRVPFGPFLCLAAAIIRIGAPVYRLFG